MMYIFDDFFSTKNCNWGSAGELLALMNNTSEDWMLNLRDYSEEIAEK